ncbi:hypothetical protein GC209_13945 [bacterium]|nr:hypothetical protein [bacterium]
MTFQVQLDENDDPYLFAPGDMGTFHLLSIGRNAATGEELTGRFLIRGTAKFTGGTDADGSPTLANNHPLIEPEDIPADYPWPLYLGPDPRG